MELTSYFTDRQKLTLKSLWIPGIILVLLGLLFSFFNMVNGDPFIGISQNTFTIAMIITSIKLAIAYGWEHIVSKDYKKALITIAGFIVVNIGVHKLLHQMYGLLPSYIDSAFIGIIWWILQVAGICFISGKKNFWQIGLVAGLFICYTSNFPFSPISYVRIWSFNLQHVLEDFFTPLIIYGWIYLAENYFNDKGYPHIITSKIQVISSKEYRVLYPLVSISCWVVIYQSANLLKAYALHEYVRTGFSDFQSHTTLTSMVNFVMVISIFYITATMTRNIAISRMNTVGNNNGWLYLLHFIPLLNIIVWHLLAKAAPQHNSKSENSIFYLAERTSPINNYIIGLGVLSSIWGLWIVFSTTPLESSVATGILFLIMFVRLVNYFFLDKGKNAVLLLVALGTIASFIQYISAAGIGKPTMGLFLVSVLSYFFLIEIFHPELEKADTAIA